MNDAKILFLMIFAPYMLVHVQTSEDSIET